MEMSIMSKPESTRRIFLRNCAATAFATPFIVNSNAFGANDKIVMGCIGMGGQGRGDMGALMHFDDVRVVAVCDVVDKHLNMATNQGQQQIRQ